MTSSERDEMNGMIIIPITNPAAKADSEATSKPNIEPVVLKKGATVKAAKKP